jgi:lipopolysaccharide heptosyltransferase II
LKVLFIRLSSLGDILLTFPLVSFFKSKYPDSEITYLAKSEYSELLSLNKDIDKVVLFDKASTKLSRLRRTIKENEYEFIFDLHNNLRSNLLCVMNGIKRSKFNKHSFRKYFLVKFKINLLRNFPQISKRYFSSLLKFNLLNPVGFDDFLYNYSIPVSTTEKENILIKFPFLKNHKNIIGFCPSARHNTKMFPAGKFIKIGQALIKDKDSAIVLFGSADEFDYCESIRKQISEKQCYNLAGDTGIFETSTLLTQCNIVVTNDTGLMHLSNLLNLPLFAIFGSTVKEFGFFPKGSNAHVFENRNIKCRPCSHIGLSNCPKKHFKCMLDINETEILSRIKEIL